MTITWGLQHWKTVYPRRQSTTYCIHGVQAETTGESMLRRQDAAPRPYWLRDWQSDFGGFTKVYEYVKGEEVRRMYSVAYVTRPRTRKVTACLCFTFLSGIPKKKPWRRDPDVRDTSRSIVLDLQEFDAWQMAFTVKMALFDPAESLDDDMQVRRLPVYKAETPQWTYRKVPKVTSLGIYGKTPIWCRKPQPLVYQLCAEDVTKSTLVYQLSDAEKQLLHEAGSLPFESSAMGKRCVMCPVKHESPKLLPCCLCENWRHVPCSYQMHLGRVCPCHVRILDPRT